MYNNIWGGDPSPYVYLVHRRGKKEVDAGLNGTWLFILKSRWEIQHPPNAKMPTITPQHNRTHPNADEEDIGGWGGYGGSGASLWGWVRLLRQRAGGVKI